MKSRISIARNPVARNPVAKNMRTFNKAHAQIDRKKQLKSGYLKHGKGQLQNLDKTF